IIKVFGEAFSKKLRKTPPFSIKRRHPKTFPVFQTLSMSPDVCEPHISGSPLTGRARGGVIAAKVVQDNRTGIH
ncbi:hypothetical protein, partial [Novacetimonas hansenii]|uniref:hypothetical protein n=1 Tax=Novacetimonas hansenii TaxID=436 RepID=UPI001C4CBD30